MSTPSSRRYSIEHALGAELVWWREDGDRHTLLTIHAPLFADVIGASRIGLTFVLHDVEGRVVTSWQREIGAKDTLFVESRSAITGIPSGFTEGALVVWVSPVDAVPELASLYVRAYAMVDYFSERGELVSFHADQSVIPRSGSIELTEIVLRETLATSTFLVLVNGPDEQPPAALHLELRNARGEARTVDYPRAMAPFSVHRIALRELCADLVAFCGDSEATISGTFEARGVFTRPYVMTEGQVVSGYHGGNRYGMRSIPRIVHRTFPFAEAKAPFPRELMLVTGQQETNPAYAAHGASLTTHLHLFQSHGDLDDDFFVDATLFDPTGRVAHHRERWAVAPRRGAATCAIAELTGGAPFEGHIALRFSDDRSKEAFPHRLQALVEYRTDVSVARSMLWSDRWNAADRVLDQRPHRAVYRVFARGDRTSMLAITNPSVAADYDRVAPYVVRLRSARGEELVHRSELAPFATRVATIAEMFLDRWGDELALVEVESSFDLASMHLTRDARSGVVAAEHLMAVRVRIGEDLVRPCGA